MVRVNACTLRLLRKAYRCQHYIQILLASLLLFVLLATLAVIFVKRRPNTPRSQGDVLSSCERSFSVMFREGVEWNHTYPGAFLLRFLLQLPPRSLLQSSFNRSGHY